MNSPNAVSTVDVSTIPRLIEVDLPIRRISAHASREKSIRHGHISTMHMWWARRPLGACRAVLLAALWPDPANPNCPPRFREEAATRMRDFRDQRGGPPRNWTNGNDIRDSLLEFIAEFSAWENSTNRAFIEISRSLVQTAYEALGGSPATRPLVVDPFSGGGAIPFEALRIGADTFASDLNPVAILLNKVLLEYVPKYGSQLADEVRKRGELVGREFEWRTKNLYPSAGKGQPVAYLWAREVRCIGPGCGAKIPLLRSLILAKRGGNQSYFVFFLTFTGSERSLRSSRAPIPRILWVAQCVVERQRAQCVHSPHQSWPFVSS